MNKKFLSAIMCGAMLTASTSVFVSCEDYGDDIAHLQTQIDQNAAASASELAGKVAALEGQISTLKAAQDNMKDQLAEAKAAAAAAANEAAAAAAKAQATADAAQSGAADAKAAAAAAQAAADAANKGLADAVARVAVLETKVASLEATIAGLTASDKELSAKLNDLQVLANSLKNASDASAEEIKAIKAEIAAKTAELAGQVAKISAEFGAKIDAINAELNTIKANYATKNELNEKAAELAAIDATLAEQIAANEAYIAAMQEAIAALEAEDAELAALIAENQAAALAQIEAANEELAAQKEAVEAELATINEKIDEVNGAVEQLVAAVMGNKNALEDFQVAVEKVVNDLDGQIQSLIIQANGNYEAIVGILENLDKLNTAADDMQGQISDLTGIATNNWEQITQILAILAEQEEYNTNLNLVISQLQTEYSELFGAFDLALTDLTKDVKALQEWTVAYDAKYAEFVKAQEEAIAAELKKLENISTGLVAAQAAIVELQNKIDAVINGLQSVVFVPMYDNTDFDIPVYHINTYTKNSRGAVVDGTDLFPVSTIKFRLEPAGYAKQLAEIYAKNNNILELESADKLAATRATAAANYLKIESVVAEGDYLVLGVSKKDNTLGEYPTTLVVSNKTTVSQTTNDEGETVANEITLSKTSDYFTVKLGAEDDALVNNKLNFSATPKSNVKPTQEINALYKESTVHVAMYHNVFNAYSIVGSAATQLEDATGAVLPYDGKNISSRLRVVEADGTVFTDKVTEVNTPYFTVKADGTIAVRSTKEGLPVHDNVDKTIEVKVVDDAYQLNSNGEAYVVYNYIFTIVENTYVYNIPNFVFAMEWPKTTAAAQKITVATIAADQNNLDAYKLTAKNVFDAMFAQVKTAGVIILNNGTLTVELKAVDKTDKEEAHITVTPIVSLAQNYNKDITWNKAYTFELDDQEAKVTLGVSVDLSIPGLEKFFEKINMYWLGEGDNTLQVNYHLVDVTGGGKKYQYYVDMNTVYMFHNKDVNYRWSIDAVKKTEKGKTETATLSNISFNNDTRMFVFTAPVLADYPTLTDDKNYDVADLTFTVEAYHNATSFGTHTNQKFNVTYPISAGDFKAPNNVEFDMDDLKQGKEFEVTKGVSLTDRDGNTWIYEGQILTADMVDPKLTAVATEWGIENLEYSISKVMSDGQNLTEEKLFSLPKTGGKLTVNRPENITKPVTVTIKVSVDYTYAKGISAEYNVIVTP